MSKPASMAFSSWWKVYIFAAIINLQVKVKLPVNYYRSEVPSTDLYSSFLSTETQQMIDHVIGAQKVILA
jgi:hypothetical protein